MAQQKHSAARCADGTAGVEQRSPLLRRTRAEAQRSGGSSHAPKGMFWQHHQSGRAAERRASLKRLAQQAQLRPVLLCSGTAPVAGSLQGGQGERQLGAWRGGSAVQVRVKCVASLTDWTKSRIKRRRGGGETANGQSVSSAQERGTGGERRCMSGQSHITITPRCRRESFAAESQGGEGRLDGAICAAASICHVIAACLSIPKAMRGKG